MNFLDADAKNNNYIAAFFIKALALRYLIENVFLKISE